MFRPHSTLLALATAAVLAGPVQAQSPVTAALPDSTPVIEAGTMSITKGEFERMLANDPRMKAALGEPNGKRALGTDFGKAFALEAEARRRKVDQDPSVQLRIRNFTQQLLAHELMLSLRRELLSEGTQVRRAYDADPERYAQPQVRQILVRTPGSQVPVRKGQRELTEAQAKARAEALLARLAQGADFATLARTESDDSGSAARGGDIGFVARGTMAADFEDAAYKLPLNTLSPLVKTEFGFHILRVEARQPLPFDRVRQQIANELAHAAMEQIIVNGYKLNTAYFDAKP